MRIEQPLEELIYWLTATREDRVAFDRQLRAIRALPELRCPLPAEPRR